MVMMVEVQVVYHIENIVKIPPFWKIHGDFLSKTPPFCWNPWTMPQTEKNPLSPCKCGLAYAPLLDWTAVAGLASLNLPIFPCLTDVNLSMCYCSSVGNPLYHNSRQDA